MLSCLRELSQKDAYEHSNLPEFNKFLLFPWLPVVDGDYLTKNPYKLFNDGDYPDYDAIVGVTQDEATFFLTQLGAPFDRETDAELTQSQFEKAIKDTLWMLPEGIQNDVKVSTIKLMERSCWT